MSLFSTASIFQATFLAEFFYKYLGSRTSLGIHRPVGVPFSPKQPLHVNDW